MFASISLCRRNGDLKRGDLIANKIILSIPSSMAVNRDMISFSVKSKSMARQHFSPSPYPRNQNLRSTKLLVQSQSIHTAASINSKSILAFPAQSNCVVGQC